MKSMIFAAGLGTRLKPITDTLPKALVPVNGKPLIELTCRKLMAAGINEAVVNIHHFADKIEDWAAHQDWVATSPEQLEEGKILLRFSDERQQLLETGGAVLYARRFLQDDSRFLIHNVDILSNADLKWFESKVKPEALSTLLVSKREATRFLLFHPETMRLVGWHNLHTGEYRLSDESLAVEDCSAYGFSGIHIMSGRIFNLMEEYAKWRNLPVEDPAGVKFSIMNFYLWAAIKYPIYGVVAEDLNFIDVGKLDAIAPAEAFVNQI